MISPRKWKPLVRNLLKVLACLGAAYAALLLFQMWLVSFNLWSIMTQPLVRVFTLVMLTLMTLFYSRSLEQVAEIIGWDAALFASPSSNVAVSLGDLEEGRELIERKRGRSAADRWYWKQWIVTIPRVWLASVTRTVLGNLSLRK